MECGCLRGLGSLIARRRRDGRIKFGYWGIRGLGAPIRMLLEYAGADYEDKRYTDVQEWFERDKPMLAKTNPLANLPYLEDDDGKVVVCQTNAVFEYLGDRFGLGGVSMEERRVVRQLLEEIYDLRNIIIFIVYPFHQKCRDDKEFKVNLEKHLQMFYKAPYMKLEAVYAHTSGGGPYALGARPCIADFHIWEILDQHEVYASKMGLPSPIMCGSFPCLAKLYKAMREEPKLRKYFASPAAKLPCNAGMSYTSKLLNC